MNTTSVETEMSLINMGDLLKNMNRYARFKMCNVDTKQLEGRTPEDIVQDTILKVLEGSRSWKDSKLDNFTTFLFGCLRSEISHLLRQIENRGNRVWKLKDYLLNYNENGIKYAIENKKKIIEN